MSGSFRIARIAGSEVRIHYTFPLLVAYWAWLGYQGDGVAGMKYTLILGFSIFFCVLLHEFGHALTGRAFGIRTPDITLLPIGGLARLERIPKSPIQEFLITVAGPAVNVVIALILLPFSHSLPSVGDLLWRAGLPDEMVDAVLWMNLYLVVFNLIPAFPMDGGRILRSLLATQLPYAKATRIAATLGQGIAILFVLGGLISQQFFLLLIGVFIFIGARQEHASVEIRESVESHTLAEVMTTSFETLSGSLRLGDLPDLLLASRQQVFPVVDDDMRYLGLAVREDLMNTLRQGSSETLLADAAHSVPAVLVGTSLARVLEMMQVENQPLLPVVNVSHQIVGLVEFARMTARPTHA